MKFKKGYIFIALFLTLVFTGPHFWQLFSFDSQKYEIQEKTNYFENLKLEAKSFFIWDINKQKVLYSQNKEAQLPLASLTKIITAATALSMIKKNDLVLIKMSDIKEEGDSGLLAGESLSLKNLLELVLVSSSNDGASAIASVYGSKKNFINKMNNEAKNLNLKQTYFLNESGLDLNLTTSGGYGSAKDIALAMEYVLLKYPDIFEATSYKNINVPSSVIIHLVRNTNKKVESFPGLMASKTGFTDLAGGNLVIAFNAGLNKPIIISLLGSSIDGRFKDMKKLVDATIKEVSKN